MGTTTTTTTSNGCATWGTRAPGSGISTHPDITPCCSDTILDSRGGAARAPLCVDPPRPSPPGDVALIPSVALPAVCMAMHYSSNDERTATIVAYPKEGNAALNVRFLPSPARYPPPPQPLYWIVGIVPWAPQDTAPKIQCFNPTPFDRMHTNACAFCASRFWYQHFLLIVRELFCHNVNSLNHR